MAAASSSSSKLFKLDAAQQAKISELFRVLSKVLGNQETTDKLPSAVLQAVTTILQERDQILALDVKAPSQPKVLDKYLCFRYSYIYRADDALELLLRP